MLRLYDYWESGNCYKVRLLLHLLELPFERIPIDILAGKTRTQEFLAKNANHRGRSPFDLLRAMVHGAELVVNGLRLFLVAHGIL
ncbi:MAG: hypothetical protein ACFB8W_19755 [Elainellaceae cyanobacterium]